MLSLSARLVLPARLMSTMIFLVQTSVSDGCVVELLLYGLRWYTYNVFCVAGLSTMMILVQTLVSGECVVELLLYGLRWYTACSVWLYLLCSAWDIV